MINLGLFKGYEPYVNQNRLGREVIEESEWGIRGYVAVGVDFC